MSSRFVLFILCLSLVSRMVFAAEPVDFIQGNWIGTWEGQGGMGGKNVAQIYGIGDGGYQAIFTAYDSGEQDKGEFTFAIRGATTAEKKVVFDQMIDLVGLGKFTFHADVADGKLLGKYSNGKEYEGTLELKRIETVPDAVGLKPLPGAKILFDGTNLEHWIVIGEEPAEWQVADGILIAPTSERLSPVKTDHLVSRDPIYDAQIHLEFRVPYLPEKRGANRGQSGVFLLGKYELQIVDSFGFPRLTDAQGYFADTDAAGAIFGQLAPTELPALPPGEWQAFDITLFPEVRNEAKATVKPAQVTVSMNGTMIHDRVELKKATPGAPVLLDEFTNRLVLQNSGQPVAFRNIWYVPLETSVK